LGLSRNPFYQVLVANGALTARWNLCRVRRSRAPCKPSWQPESTCRHLRRRAYCSLAPCRSSWELRAFGHQQRVGRVDRWTTSDQKHRWLATTLLEIEPRLRRLRGYRALPQLRAALKPPATPERVPQAARGAPYYYPVNSGEGYLIAALKTALPPPP